MLYLEINEDAKPRDMEERFARFDGIPDTPLNRRLLKEIEQAEYYDEFNILDRFGAKLNIRFISTGCKVALLVANTDDQIDLVECGCNARDAILKNCTQGSILLHHFETTIEGDRDTPIEVMLDGQVFRTTGELDDYIKDEY